MGPSYASRWERWRGWSENSHRAAGRARRSVRCTRPPTGGAQGSSCCSSSSVRTAGRRPREPSSEVLFDYFAGEIFKKADSTVQAVLLHTAFLPRVTGAMAVALTGQPAAGEVLTALHEQNYFTNNASE